MIKAFGKMEFGIYKNEIMTSVQSSRIYQINSSKKSLSSQVYNGTTK